MSKSALAVLVGAVSTLSVGAGTYLAFRANQTPAPVIHDFEAARPVSSPSGDPQAAEPARDAVARKAPPSQPVRPSARQREIPVADPPPTRPAIAPPPSDPVAVPPPPTAPTAQSVEPPPATATSSASTSTSASAATVIEPPPAQEPLKTRFEELTVKTDSVIGIKLDQNLSSETARVEDRVTAKVTRDVTVDGRTAIAAGTRLEGVVTLVERGGKFKERARLAIRFNMLVLTEGLRVPVQTEAILREGDSPASEAGSKIGASAVAGAIIGGLIGGKRGAVIGSTAGAAGGTAVVASGGRNEAAFQGGVPLTLRLTAPVTITIEREYEPR